MRDAFRLVADDLGFNGQCLLRVHARSQCVRGVREYWGLEEFHTQEFIKYVS